MASLRQDRGSQSLAQEPGLREHPGVADPLLMDQLGDPGGIAPRHRQSRETWVQQRSRLVLGLQLAQQCDIIEQLSDRSGLRGECRGPQLQQLFQRELELLPEDLRERLLLPLL